MDLITLTNLVTSVPSLVSTGLDVLTALNILGLPVGLIGKVVMLFALYVWVFWGLFALVMNLYRLYLKGTLTTFQKVMGVPYVAVGYAFDMLSQYTIACLIFWGLPRRGERFVTSRLQRLRAEEPASWRGKLATFICEQGLDSLDPTGDHC